MQRAVFPGDRSVLRKQKRKGSHPSPVLHFPLFFRYRILLQPEILSVCITKCIKFFQHFIHKYKNASPLPAIKEIFILPSSFVSDMELFLDVLIFPSTSMVWSISKQSFRRNIHIQHAVAPQCHDIYIIFPFRMSSSPTVFPIQASGMEISKCHVLHLAPHNQNVDLHCNGSPSRMPAVSPDIQPHLLRFLKGTSMYISCCSGDYHLCSQLF